MKKKKHVFLKIMLIFVILGVSLLCFGGTYYFITTKNTTLNTDKFSFANSNFKILDSTGQSIDINTISNSYCTYENLNNNTINAFICAEDKRFFKHNGIDYLRVMGAIKNNIFHPNKKQGGSTITQQVIKNTQLSSEKTIQRKLKEFKLARELEKQYTKEQILEIYLNSIYFGNGCYGINNASRFYFDKSPKDLSISESALLASTINAPSVYDPINNSATANKRKELILNLMYKEGKINENELIDAKNEKITITKTKKMLKNNYLSGVISEACKLLKVNESMLKNMNLEISTYYDQVTENEINKIINDDYKYEKINANLATIVIDNKTHGVVAITGSINNILQNIRQPGSLIKPIIVYAPAFESRKYTPASYIMDEPININGYSPENASKKYSGMVTIRESIEKSLNIPAVKIFDNLGTKYCKSVASNMGITFNNNDNNLALALGGFTTGLNIKSIADAYSTFSNDGYYYSSKFIKSIKENGEYRYNHLAFSKKALSTETCYMINNVLEGTAKNGTAKRLNGLNYQVCSKTGTVGSSQGNTDAYNVCYTTQHTICTWVGTDNLNSTLEAGISGATHPTTFNKYVLQKLYKNKKPNDFIIPESISFIGLNQDALKEYKLERDDTSEYKEIFYSDNIPPLTNRKKLDVKLAIDNFENGKPILKFEAKRQNIYEIYRIHGNNFHFLTNINFSDGPINYIDESAISGQIYEYYVVAKYNSQTQESNHIKLICN